jgi:peptide/nickel transport system ATP-binding protein
LTDLLTATNLSVRYGSGDLGKLAIDNVSFSVPSTHYTMGLVGESGSGKTTLGMSLMKLITRPGIITSGEIRYNNVNVLDMNEKDLRTYRWKEVSMIFQSAMNSLNPVKRAADHITEVIRDHSETSRSNARDRALSLLSEVGIEKDHADDFPHELSGGMRQRVVIALALALSPKLVIADEPTSALDVVVQKQILGLLKREISQRGLSLVFITHDLPILAGLVDYISVMFAGEIVEHGKAQDIFKRPMHPYTEALLSSLLTLDSKDSHPRSLKELREVQKPIATMGCKYQNRCKYAFERCKMERPLLKDVESGRKVACHKYN